MMTKEEAIKTATRLQETASAQGTTIIRMRFALQMLRQFSTNRDFSGDVRKVVCDWIDGGMEGPIPWPDNPFFAQWAEIQGWSNVEGYVGFSQSLSQKLKDHKRCHDA